MIGVTGFQGCNDICAGTISVRYGSPILGFQYISVTAEFEYESKEAYK